MNTAQAEKSATLSNPLPLKDNKRPTISPINADITLPVEYSIAGNVIAASTA